MIRIALALIWLAAVASAVSAQSETRGVGVRPGAENRTFGASSGNDVLRHRAATGTPCLEVGGLARRHVMNPKVFDHVVTAKNSCPQRITMQVCYYRSQDCQTMEVPGGERREAILGSLPSAQEFRFEFREKF